MMDQNTCFAYLNMELPDDIRRLKELGDYLPLICLKIIEASSYNN